MAVLSKDELLQLIRDRVGEDDTDEALQFLEDVTDTINNMVVRLDDNTDWKKKYEENDTAWRKRYRERFNTPVPDSDVDTDDIDENDENVSYNYEDLFNEEE